MRAFALCSVIRIHFVPLGSCGRDYIRLISHAGRNESSDCLRLANTEMSG